jgi:hypothetical protein
MWAAVKHYATIDEMVFSVGTAPRLCKEDLQQLEINFSVSGVGGWQNN